MNARATWLRIFAAIGFSQVLCDVTTAHLSWMTWALAAFAVFYALESFENTTTVTINSGSVVRGLDDK